MPKSYKDCPRSVRVNAYSTPEEAAYAREKGKLKGLTPGGYLRYLLQMDMDIETDKRVDKTGGNN
jgi:hypothetical protein